MIELLRDLAFKMAFNKLKNRFKSMRGQPMQVFFQLSFKCSMCMKRNI